jgi:hypothetical protein
MSEPLSKPVPNQVSNTEHESSSLKLPEASPAAGLSAHETVEPQAELQAEPQASSLFYTKEEGEKFDFNRPLVDEDDAPFVLPFQLSSEMEPAGHSNASHAQPASASSASSMSNASGTPGASMTPSIRTRLTLRVVKYLLIASVVLVTLVGASLLVFAQSPQPSHQYSTPLPTQGAHVQTPAHTTPSATRKAKPSGTPAQPAQPTQMAQPTQTNPPQSQGGQGGMQNGGSADSFPSTTRLAQIGWSQAGFSLGDALEAQRTALTFTDREMSYDYRDIGTRAQHGGTLTGAVFLLTPGGQARFNQNDIRVINNTLYDQVSADRIIQQVVNMQASFDQVGTVQQQGQVHQLVWITVTFELFQAQTTSGQRSEGLELDGRGQPVQHQMHVLLLRVTPQAQGANAPMGGTGWLVNTYARDTTHLPLVETVPSL